MSPITTHVLDTSSGTPAGGLAVGLSFREKDGWHELGRGRTNKDGRVADLLADGTALRVGTYRLRFETGAYFRGRSKPCFYPEVSIIFEIQAANEHYHVPLLLSPFGYSTYRGS